MEVEKKKVSKAQQKAVHKYVSTHYDRINVTVPKGQREIIRAAAEKRGLSVNAYIVAAVNAALERDSK